MKRTYPLTHQSLAYVLLVSFLLQSCGGVGNAFIPIEKEPKISMGTSLESMASQIDIQPLIGQELVAQGGHIVTCYEEDGTLKADVEMNAPKGFSKTYEGLSVSVEQGAELAKLPHLSKLAQEYRIHLQLAKAEQPAKVMIYKGSGLMGGMMLDQEEEAQEEEEVVGDEGIPDECFCPITQEIMEDPVIAQDGHTYERAAIQQWFGTGRRTSPKTGARLLSIELLPNYTMRSLIQDLKAQIPVLARHELNLNNIEAAIKLREEDMQQELELKGGLLQEQQQRVAYLEAQLAELTALQKQTSRLTLSGRTASGSVTFYGQPGVGKSTLANSIFGEAIFESGTSLAGPITTHNQAQQHGGILYIDTPSLDNVEVRKKAAEDIEEALKSNKNYKVVFVLTLDSGKLRPADLVSIGTVCDAIRTPFHYGLIFNKVEKEIIDKVGKGGVIDLTHLKKQPASTLILEKDLTIEGKENAHFPTNSENKTKLLNFISSLKANNVSDTTQGGMYANISQERSQQQLERERIAEYRRQLEEDRKDLIVDTNNYFFRHATKKNIDWEGLILPESFKKLSNLKKAEAAARYYKSLLYEKDCKYGGWMLLARTCYKRNRFTKLLSPEQMGLTRIEPTCFKDSQYDKQLIRYLRDGLLELVSLKAYVFNPFVATMRVKNVTNSDINFKIPQGQIIENNQFRDVQNLTITGTINLQGTAERVEDRIESIEDRTFIVKANSELTIDLHCRCIDPRAKSPNHEEFVPTNYRSNLGSNQDPKVTGVLWETETENGETDDKNMLNNSTPSTA
ncbi:MAG: U-box domain-containing protein [Candidatus Amoebophilus sp.]